jgi:hypothetical protein
MERRGCMLQIRLGSVERGSDPGVTQQDVDYLRCSLRMTGGDNCKLLELIVQDLANAKVKGSAELEMNWLLMHAVGWNRNNSRACSFSWKLVRT